MRGMRVASMAAVLCVGTTLWAPVNGVQEKKITAREVVEEIKRQVGVPWQAETVDTFKAGNPDTPVTGIAVTMMATMDVLQRARIDVIALRVNGREHGNYLAEIDLMAPHGRERLSCRPSDGLVLALRMPVTAPILVDERLLDDQGDVVPQLPL